MPKRRTFFMSILVSVVGLLTTAASVCASDPYKPATGDVIFQTSASFQSRAIQRATDSSYSHVGMLVFRNGKLDVVEAEGMVKYTPVGSWLKRGVGGKYLVRRYKGGLTESQKNSLAAEAERFIGKPYDLAFEWSDDRIYCSELVWKIYKNALSVEIAPTRKLRSFKLNDPEVRPLILQRYGTKIPLDETVIAPSDLYESFKFDTLAAK